MRLKVIACAIFFRELCHLAAKSGHVIDLAFLPQGLHRLDAADMTERIQNEIDATDAAGFDAILLAYGLCNNGLAGVKARQVRLVVPRAHDCITLFLGSKERYHGVFKAEPGTYFYTTGWFERDENDEGNGEPLTANYGTDGSFEDYVKQYGKENAQYIWDTLHSHERNYTRAAFISTGIADEAEYRRLTRAAAQKHGWNYEELKGDLSLLAALLEGEWDDARFLVVPPGGAVQPSYTDTIFKGGTVPCQ